MVQGLKRLPNWRSRLAEFLDAGRAQPFQWGSNDCVGFARGIVLAITGEDVLQGWQPNYKSESGARRALRDFGHADLQAALGHYLPQVGLLQADIGDLALVPAIGPIGIGIGMVDVSLITVMGLEGHGYVPRSSALAIYSVG